MKAISYSLVFAFVLFSVFCHGQDSAPVNLDFEPDSSPKVQSDEEIRQKAAAQGVYGLPVRYVKTEGRWSRGIQLPLKPGDILTSDNLSAAMHALRDAITADSNVNIGFRSKGEVGVFYLAPKFDTSPEVDANGNAQAAGKTVGVILQPFYLDISLVQVGDNILPIPRSAFPTFYQNVPKLLLALNPTVALSYDRAFGSAISASLTTDLTQQFQLHADATKSFEEKFYRAKGGLSYALRRDEGWLRQFSVSAAFDGSREPLAGRTHKHEAGVATLGLQLRLAQNTRLALDAGYQRTDDNFVTSARANQQVGRLRLDSIPRGITGFVRAAFWEESAWQTTASGNSYQRFVGRLGYEKEIRIAENQTIGIELLGGGGVVTSGTPAFARFYAGNAPGQFLYDSPDSLTSMPSGPILRSFGENEAHLRNSSGLAVGGKDFWHVNLNVTIPVRPLSRSLIPNESTDIPDINGYPLTIKQLLSRQIDVTGPSMLAAVLKHEGMSQSEANVRAKQILNEVSPAARFVINDANILSLKPLLMFDAAGLSDRDGASATWLAAGGGLQLTVVIAKLEVGYMHTISGPTFGHDGNAFVRLIFQNLF
ncbi:MAG: BamA/TamA family outer membrane protein [Verrucomicrobiota bacterium]|nr:BamA/TamA family outer membrane protein [Verrucomicrobiota bacterium]